jgi:hypothetical protein
MDSHLTNLAKKYSSKRKGNISQGIKDLYLKYVKDRENTIIDTAGACAAVNAIFLSDQIDFEKITPQMKEAFYLAYPNIDLDSLSSLNPEEVSGFISGWKVKYFEVIVRDKLNAGEWVGDLHL